MRKNPQPGEIYRHFKGNLYRIITLATHSETREAEVVYQALYGSFGLYTRPLGMFLGPVDKDKYPGITQEYRFERVQPGTGTEENKKQPVSEEKTVDTAQDAQMEMPLAGTVMMEESEETVREEILRFLDAEGAGAKLEVLRALRKNMDEQLMTTIELSMDLLPDERESLERRYELVERTLEQRIRFEGGRLR